MSTSLVKKTLRIFLKSNFFIAKSDQTNSQVIGQWFKWLAPGLFIKRWLLLSAAGVLLTSLGLSIWTGMTPIFYTLRLLKEFLGWVTTIVPSYISGPIIIFAGLLFIFWGQNRSINSITQVLIPEGEEKLVDRLLAHRRLNRGPKIVAIGGGTGLSTLLRGIKDYSANITAVVTVADDGGSSGRLRREIGVLPPGDIRNCLAALANEEKLLTELFQYRFRAGDGLVGHSFGNLFLTAMSEVTGDLEQAVAASSQVLAIRGQVLPATLTDVNLWAELADGRRIEGESNITEARGKIVKIGCTPEHPLALPKVLQAIEEADYIIIGPGSLYTSVIPNLLVSEIAEAIMLRTSNANASRNIPSIYVCNIMTQPGETTGYTVADHIRAIDVAAGKRLFDTVLVQGKSPSAQALVRYAQEDSHPVFLDREAVRNLGRKILLTNVMYEDEETGFVRHDSMMLAQVLLEWYERIEFNK
ncbi:MULTISPECIES: uridine diphosphate-N-acetylglucosamine-binding protein YvcK [unclassified Okeania]|uniref:gluconeogenesis factor YvcK family protein n=1 Tax=unclassified Okeania TaxID=2634635 RepID=UPI0013BCBDF9|nr:MULTISPECIES: uridine diphosphate-N-acetylglucosamine-binding protein YvcK [unclassified Okeania]NES75531.1 uridine diphosphate-N-acetylglucosamine-binding protein YvcK [Okeania sp. SIO1H4]NET16680.1 uridine diphosphate-N-acetylglucosamine-binding protein YvcK [Okeania sp. SIO1H6]NET17959.1 uridine diphosphate-N-acetylglucosamine-binding protein YvcK [Okeania sp. SIO1H5]NET92819.1 uridine diphosphate-N-acetylglucosamine-binding protein YvcK [Okeania sp. SIO1H2]